MFYSMHVLLHECKPHQIVNISQILHPLYPEVWILDVLILQLHTEKTGVESTTISSDT